MDSPQATIEIETPHDNDVLSGRGNFANSHPGNIRFRSYVYAQREDYAQTPTNKKPIFARLIVDTIRNLVPPGRFLIQDKKTKLWSDVGDKKAWDKTRQALRDAKEKDAKEKPSETEVSSKTSPSGYNEQTKQMPESLSASTNSSLSTEELRLMLHRQLEVYAAKQTNNPWLSGNDILDANTDSGENGVMCFHDQDGKKIQLRASFIGGYNKDGSKIPNADRRWSSLKQKPRYTDAPQKFNDSIGTFSTGFSAVTGRSGLTGVSGHTGVSGLSDPTYVTNTTDLSYDTNTTASCSSGFGLPAPKVKIDESNEGQDDTSMMNNSLYLEGLSQTSSEKAPSGRRIIEKYNSVISGITEGTGLSDLRASGTSGLSNLKRISSEDLSLPTDRRLSLQIDNIGEGTEDGSLEEGDDGMGNISMKQSLHSGRRNSATSNIDDLSLFSKMSVDVSLPESGVFSLSQAEFEDWKSEIMGWEKEAELEDGLSMAEESIRLEKHSAEVDNMTDISSMLGDTHFH